MPSWDGVSAEREKISDIVGGLEDDPIPEVQIPEFMGREMTVTTAPAGMSAQMLGFGSQPEEKEEDAGPSYEEQRDSLKLQGRAVWMDQYAEKGLFETKSSAAESADNAMFYAYGDNPFYIQNYISWEKEFRAEKGID